LSHGRFASRDKKEPALIELPFGFAISDLCTDLQPHTSSPKIKEILMSDDIYQPNAVELATELTIAWLSNPNTRTSADDVPSFLLQMHASVQSLVGGSQALETPAEESKEYVGAVTARKSLASPDHIISMIDGKAYKTLRRHLATNGMTPSEYRERYNLKADYPMVAATYSESRRAMAKKIGLGRKPGQTNAAKAEAAKPALRKRKANDDAAE
jgi:predicted transcriptional regulator